MPLKRLFLIICYQLLWLSNTIAANYKMDVDLRTETALSLAQMNLDLNPECAESTHRQILNFSQYTLAFAKENKSVILEKLNQYETFFNSLNGVCKQQAFEAVAIMSAFGAYRYKSIEEGNQLLQFLSYLQKKHMIYPLDQKSKTENQVLQNPDIMGAYSCLQDKIWLSTEAKPHNLGFILIHELEHWARSLVYEYAIDNPEQLEIPNFLKKQEHSVLFDETLSSMSSALKQVTLRRDYLRARENSIYERGLLGLYWNSHSNKISYQKKFFQTQLDINLYNPNGNLVKLWTENIEISGVERNINFDDFILRHFYSTSTRSLGLNIFKMVESIYLPKSNIAEELYLETKESMPKYRPYYSPLDWLIKNQKIKNIQELDQKKSCAQNKQINPKGGESVGLTDDAVRLDHSIMSCLKPLDQL